jgi:hypothetical protein
VNVSRGTRHTDDRHDDVRSMQFVAACCAVLLLLTGAGCWEVLRRYVLGAIL